MRFISVSTSIFQGDARPSRTMAVQPLRVVGGRCVRDDLRRIQSPQRRRVSPRDCIGELRPRVWRFVVGRLRSVRASIVFVHRSF